MGKLFKMIIIFIVIVAIGSSIGKLLNPEQDLEQVEKKPNAETHIAVTALTAVTGAVGGGKEDLLSDQRIAEILADEYGINLDAHHWSNGKLISQELVYDTNKKPEKYDFAFFSDERFYEYYKTPAKNDEAPRLPIKKSYISLSTPIVIYSWAEAVELLIAEGIVTENKGIYYISDMEKLLNYTLKGKTWKELGHSTANNRVGIISPDPLTSSPGVTFYGLIAASLADSVDIDSINKILPELKQIYKLSGSLNNTPADLFASYIRYGSSGYQLVADYEKSIIEYANKEPEGYENIKDDIRILYPQPTMWNSHCLISFNEKGSSFLDAFQNDEISDIAWTKYGFRTGNNIVLESPVKGVAVSGMPIPTMISPSKNTFDTIEAYLKTEDSHGTENNTNEAITLLDYAIYIDSISVQMNNKPFVMNDRILVPMETILGYLNLDVLWEGNTATLVSEEHLITFSIGSADAYVDNRLITLDAAPIMKSGEIYVPLRFFAESLGYSVNWDSNTEQIDIISPN